MYKITRLAAIGAVLAPVLFAAPAQAQNAVSYVATTGNDANGCSNSTSDACRTVHLAMFKTNNGGQIVCVDSGDFRYGGGGYSPVQRSLTIDCAGKSAIINQLEIEATGIVVTVRNVTILNTNGTTGSGVLIDNAASVIIENCVIKDFNGSSGTGIFVRTTNALQLNMTDTLIVNNTDGTNNAGILIAPTGSGNTTFALDRVRVESNARGGFAVNAFGTGVVTGVIRDSVVTGNGQFGIFVNNNSSAQVTVSLDHTHVAGNGLGITTANGVAVILNNSTIQTNHTGLSAGTGAAIFSYGNNAINGNQPNGNGTAPIVIGLH
jgi:hypothetical protein